MTPPSAFRADARFFHVLSSPIRLAVLAALKEGTLTVQEIKERVPGVPDSKLSYHLSVLSGAELIRGVRRMNFIDYSLTILGEEPVYYYIPGPRPGEGAS